MFFCIEISMVFSIRIRKNLISLCIVKICNKLIEFENLEYFKIKIEFEKFLYNIKLVVIIFIYSKFIF